MGYKTIDFELEENYLVLCKTPENEQTIKDYNNKLERNEDIRVNSVFFVNNELFLGESEEGVYRFKVGKNIGNYIELYKSVFDIKHSFYFSNKIKFNADLFIKYSNMPILKRIDKIAEGDIYVTENPEERENSIDIKTYKKMVEVFPNSNEKNLYAEERISSILRDFFPKSNKYEQLYEDYIKKKDFIIKRLADNKRTEDFSSKIKLEQFKIALEELKRLVKSHQNETIWQEKVYDVLKLLYPQYVYYDREIEFDGVDGYDKKPDFILVDTNGFVDVLEMKRPDAQLLGKRTGRNNYIPTRKFSESVQQLEKYIYCLSNVEKSKNKVKTELKKNMNKELEIDFVNPRGILLIGSNNELDTEQKRKDFELIRRQYKNIIDILTFDDLINRMENVIKFVS